MSAVDKYARREGEAQLTTSVIRELVEAVASSNIFPNNPKQTQLINGMKTAIMEAIYNKGIDNITELTEFLGGLDPQNTDSKKAFVNCMNICAGAKEKPILVLGTHDGKVGYLMRTLSETTDRLKKNCLLDTQHTTPPR